LKCLKCRARYRDTGPLERAKAALRISGSCFRDFALMAGGFVNHAGRRRTLLPPKIRAVDVGRTNRV
jgi:hypothetical protein